MFCIKCGEKLQPKADFCGSCGNAAATLSRAAPPASEPIPVKDSDVVDSGIAKTMGGMWLSLLLVWAVLWGVLQLLSGLAWRAMSYATDLPVLETSGGFVVPLISAFGALYLTWRVWRVQM